MVKLDFKKELRHLYRPSTKKVEFIEVPTMNFIMNDGMGNPNTSQDYKEAVEALFSIAYNLKFMVKKGDIGVDYADLPLEGLWWMDDMTKFDPDNKDEWKWMAMIMQPEYITIDLYQKALKAVKAKKGSSGSSKNMV